jgi:hypothetical protein
VPDSSLGPAQYAVRCSAVQCSAVQCEGVQCSLTCDLLDLTTPRIGAGAGARAGHLGLGRHRPAAEQEGEEAAGGGMHPGPRLTKARRLYPGNQMCNLVQRILIDVQASRCVPKSVNVADEGNAQVII